MYNTGLIRIHILIIRLSTVSKDEVDKLLDMWSLITAGGTRLDRNKFRDVLHNTFDMTDDILMDRGWLENSFELWIVAAV